MQRNQSKILGFVLCCIVASMVLIMGSCGSKIRKNDKMVAKVGDKYLYFSEMSHIFPKGCSVDDSIALAKLYVDNWIKIRLILKKAELNLSKEQLDIAEEIETYRASLLIYKYEEYMLREKLDTTALDSEIKNYYEANIANFSSDEYVVKAVYIRLPENTPSLWNVRQWCVSDREKDIQALTEYCQRYAISFDFFDNEWIQWSKIDLPQKEAATRQLGNTNRIEQQEGGFIYLVGVKDKRAPGDTSPLVFVRDKVKSIIINKRKLKFISELEQNIYNDALLKNQFEIYNIN